MTILHICAGWQQWNGAANIASMIMGEQAHAGHEVSFKTWTTVRELRAADEVWIHCGWLPCLWWAALWGRNVHWMPEACYDPVRLGYHGWKKWLVGPIERWCLRRAARIVATCEAEKGWIEKYLGKRCPPIEVTDIKRFFKLQVTVNRERGTEVGKQVRPIVPHGNANPGSSPIPHPPSLHFLYLGRRHPLKGLEYLEEAIQTPKWENRSDLFPHFKTDSTQLTDSPFPVPHSANEDSPSSISHSPQFKIVSNAFGEEKEKVWAWCDVLVLPTLSENFGLVIAEALERGKRVITTDGAPAWGEALDEQSSSSRTCGAGRIRVGYGGRLMYLEGYREGTCEDRVILLRSAIEAMSEERTE